MTVCPTRKDKMNFINNKSELEKAFARIDQIINAKEGTQEYSELCDLADAVENYEDKNCIILPPNPYIEI